MQISQQNKRIQRLSKMSYYNMNFMEAKGYKHRTLPSFLEFSYLIAHLLGNMLFREVENKQKASGESKVISKFIHKSNDYLSQRPRSKIRDFLALLYTVIV